MYSQHIYFYTPFSLSEPMIDLENPKIHVCYCNRQNMYVEKFSAGNPEKNHEDNEDTTILF